MSEARKLQVDVVARIDKLEKAMGRAAGVTTRRTKEMESTVKRMVDRTNGLMSNFGKGLFAGLAAGGIGGLVSGFAGVAKSIAGIADQARQAGLSAGDFQRLGYVASQNRIETQDLSAAIREMQLRMDEFVTSAGKSGSAAEALQRLGYSVSDIEQKLKNPLELFTELVGRVEKFDKAAQIRLFDEVFGGDGERLIRILDQGEAGIRRMVKEADMLGIHSDDVIKRAAELDRQFQIVSTTVGTALKGAIVDAATALQDFIAAFRGFEAERDAKLDERLAALGRERLDTETKIAEIRARGDGRAGDGFFGTSFGDSGALGAIADHERRMEAISAEEAAILKITEARRKAAEMPPATGTFTPPAATPPSTGGGSSRSSSAGETEREAEAVRRLIAELQAELSLVNATNTEKEISNALRRAGVEATSAEGQQIASLITQINAETDARDKARDAAEQQRQAVDNLFGMAGQGIESLISGTEKASEVVKKLAVQLALAVAQAALLGSGPLAGIFGGGGFGGGFGGGTNWGALSASGKYLFDKGGYTGAGGKYDPAGIVHKGEYVMPKHIVDKVGAGNIESMFRGYANGGLVGGVNVPSMPRLAANSNLGVSVNFAPVYNVQGSGPEIAQLRQQMARDRAELPGRVVQAVQGARKRNVRV